MEAENLLRKKRYSGWNPHGQRMWPPQGRYHSFSWIVVIGKVGGGGQRAWQSSRGMRGGGARSRFTPGASEL